MFHAARVCQPRAFGQKQAAKLPSGLFAALGRGLTGAGKATFNYGLPAAGAAAATPAIYNTMVPEHASGIERAEGAAAAGLLGMGIGSMLNPRTARNAWLKARSSAQADAAKGLSPDFLNYLQKNVTSDMLVPKARYAGLALVPAGAMGVQGVVSNANEASGNINAVTKSWKDLAQSAGKTDNAGENIMDKIRKGVEQVTGDATVASGAIAQGTQDVTKSVAEGTRDITKSLGDAAKSTAGAAESIKGVADPLKEIATEFGQKDETGQSLMANLAGLSGDARAALNDIRQHFAANPQKNILSSLGAVPQVMSALQYAPHVLGAGVGATGLYALYRAMQNKKKKRAMGAAAQRYN